MNNFTKETVDSLADKLLIGLTEEENTMVLNEFEEININMEKITKIEGIDKIEPMIHPFDLYETTMREDKESPSIPLEKLLQNCDNTQDGEIEVPKVVG